MNAEGLSIEGLGSEGSWASWDPRPPRERRIKKKHNAAAITTKSTSVTAAAAQPKDNDCDCRYLSHNAVRGIPARSHMSECPVPIQSGGAQEDHHHRSTAEARPHRQFENAAP